MWALGQRLGQHRVRAWLGCPYAAVPIWSAWALREAALIGRHPCRRDVRSCVVQPSLAQRTLAQARAGLRHDAAVVAGPQPCRALARSSGMRLLSVAYRLAPEHPFPAPVDDAIAAFRSVAARAETLAVDPRRIVVAGDSAGGHLAAVSARVTSAAGGPAPAFQLLIYPVTDLVSVSESRRTFAAGFVLTSEQMDWYESQFLGERGDRRDPRVSPLLVEDLRGCPPALVLTAGFDPLRDEGEAYAEALRSAGVPVILRRHGGSVHGFVHTFAIGRGAGEALAEIGGMLRAALAS